MKFNKKIIKFSRVIFTVIVILAFTVECKFGLSEEFILGHTNTRANKSKTINKLFSSKNKYTKVRSLDVANSNNASGALAVTGNQQNNNAGNSAASTSTGAGNSTSTNTSISTPVNTAGSKKTGIRQRLKTLKDNKDRFLNDKNQIRLNKQKRIRRKRRHSKNRQN